MTVGLAVRNESERKHCYRSDNLRRIAGRVLEGEGVDGEVELSVLFCDDPFIQELNAAYRNTDKPTDVLSFDQEAPPHGGPIPLGDIVISLETVERYCHGDRPAMRAEVRLLFCHGLLHLLGYEHKTRAGQAEMQQKQAQYLGVTEQAAWH